MFTYLLLACFVLGAPPSTYVACASASVAPSPVGGPPAIRIAGKFKGDITAAEWRAVSKIDLVGCVPDARIVGSTLCTQDCSPKGSKVHSDGAAIPAAMRERVAVLKPGMTFTITVEVTDAKGKSWVVAPATFIWRG